MENTITILDSNGNPVKSQLYDNCPQCQRDPSKRIPAGGFGVSWMICPCGYEFNKEIPCPKVLL